MNRSRDIIKEIAEVRERHRFGYSMPELVFRLAELEKSFNKFDKSDEELIRYFPVALVACMEGYLRMAIKELIDAGEPYLSNAEKLTSAIKIDFTALRAVHGKDITVGELIAHSMSLSKLDHIENILSSLLGKSFLRELITTTDRWSHEIDGNPLVPILQNPNEVFGNVARVFELRHIICHELASAYIVNIDEIANCFGSCLSFMRATDELLSETLNPGAPLTQTDMNIHAGERLNEAQSRLTKLCENLRTQLDSRRQKEFDIAQSKWQEFCLAWADFESDFHSGGTIRPMLYSEAFKELVEQRIIELTQYNKNLF